MRNLKLRRIEGNVTTAGQTATAWYRLQPVRWNWRSETERDALIVAQAQALAGLVGHRVHLRITQVHHSPAGWARRLDADARDPLLKAAHAAGAG